MLFDGFKLPTWRNSIEILQLQTLSKGASQFGSSRVPPTLPHASILKPWSLAEGTIGR